MEKPNKENYYSTEMEKSYMTFSQFKDFQNCEAEALAIIEGRFKKETTDAMLAGSYLDAFFSGEFDEFKEAHPELFKKDGSLLAKYEVAERAIDAVINDPEFYKGFFKGEHQAIFTGEIAGVPFKGKIDNLYDDYIVDMKLMKDTKDIWDAEAHSFEPFYIYYEYYIQASIYRELVRQATGKTLEYYLAVVTKEDVPSKKVYHLSPKILDDALKIVKTLAPRYQEIKDHKREPDPCGSCDYCKSQYKFDWSDIIEVSEM